MRAQAGGKTVKSDDRIDISGTRRIFSGKDKVGVFRPSTGEWLLDFNGNGKWDGCGVDACLSFGQDGDLPGVGKW
jgi:hypothetical protein